MVEFEKQRHLQNVIAATPEDENGERPAETSGMASARQTKEKRRSRISRSERARPSCTRPCEGEPRAVPSRRRSGSLAWL